MEFFQVQRPHGDGYCSDKACPCPEVRIPRGAGYLYVSQDLVDFRQDARTLKDLLRKLDRLAALQQAQYGVRTFIMEASSAINPILMCEQGARLRGLDLDIAAKDAKYWWKTGRVPLRATPLAGK